MRPSAGAARPTRPEPDVVSASRGTDLKSLRPQGLCQERFNIRLVRRVQNASKCARMRKAPCVSRFPSCVLQQGPHHQGDTRRRSRYPARSLSRMSQLSLSLIVSPRAHRPPQTHVRMRCTENPCIPGLSDTPQFNRLRMPDLMFRKHLITEHPAFARSMPTNGRSSTLLKAYSPVTAFSLEHGGVQ